MGSKEILKRGALIVFEGCDRCGKTTQCKKLVEALTKEGRKAKLWRFPEGQTQVGGLCRSYLEKKIELEDHAVHLLFAANRWELVPRMKELLSSGTTLIVDRYAFSGVAFSAAKTTMSLEWCVKPEIGLPQPDAVLYLDLPTELAAQRAAFGGERYEHTDFQKRVAKNYKLLWDESYWKRVDASRSIEELHTEIKDIVLNVMEKTGHHELKQLWIEQAGTSSGHQIAEDEPPPAKRPATSSENLLPSSKDTH